MVAIETHSPGAAHWQAGDYERVFSVAAPARMALVAEEAGRVIGFLVAQSVEPVWDLENVAVATDARRRGLARALVSAFLARARGESAEAVFLEVREANLAARALYEKLGFVQTGRRRDYYRAPVEDAILYTFSFSSPRTNSGLAAGNPG